MHTGTSIPLVSSTSTLKDTLLEMTAKGLGMAGVVDAERNGLVGIYTDGDLRRTFEKMPNFETAKVVEFMTANCVTIEADRIASEALKLMHDKKINALMVVDAEGQVQADPGEGDDPAAVGDRAGGRGGGPGMKVRRGAFLGGCACAHG